ncbi:MAG: DUF2267 domain-containing protein [Chloroflexus sp.]|jgi:uncharacterized protein (DUF2267 family)|uniref:hypothetical protein n=1 Tax=unclassified Chloroflexus TaxID=2633855 RepID=UPI0004DF310F|nr:MULTISPECIES: hypothetical protein [unclassified Chloroflexus]MBO9313722.1 DUF2267 domain-containing protein [Chloroflexus sp.]MBO9314274.1 DUF2267 domain-containing protein [Chloroflexus sp.]MBO9318778.1 DUF2267 domain-containing protein [Chloroflexus sp.]MBO9337498.1 DUF2267 domain-containing protein [Chloroflexus sp.]MBO9348715.1 DUF2267 domain-containing protein [Chloroflexus sp.]
MSSAKTLVDLIREKTGVSAEQAQQAIDVVVGFLKEKLPEPIAAQVDTVLKSDVSAIADQIDAAKTMLGGLFGGKKD